MKMKILGVKLPTGGQLMTFAVTMLILMFLLKVAPIPETWKNWFRI